MYSQLAYTPFQYALDVMRVVVSVGVLVVRSSRRVGVVCWCHVCIRLLF